MVLGVSGDTVRKHQNFKKKFDLPFTLIADTDHVVARAYGVWSKKVLFGYQYEGTDRVTFVIDPAGRVTHVFEGIDAAAHADEAARVLGER